MEQLDDLELVEVAHEDLNTMTARQEECKVKEARIAELEGKLAKLQRRLKRGGGVGGGSEEEEVETLRRRVQELEVGQEEAQQSCVVAVEELTARQEECKVKEARVAELEGKLVELQWEYQQLEVGTNFLFPHPAYWC